MYGLPTRGVEVVGERLLQMDEPALTRTVGPVLECREGNGVCRLVHVISHGYAVVPAAALGGRHYGHPTSLSEVMPVGNPSSSTAML